MIEIYLNEDNYITLTGEIIEIKQEETTIWMIIKCDQLKEYIDIQNEMHTYWVFSEAIANLSVGDTITYATASVRIRNIEWLPIVAIEKGNEKILDFETGRKNLLDWVDQLQAK